MVNAPPDISSSISSSDSWVYLANWILAVVLGLAFVFYFPRLVGFVLSSILRIVLWKQYKVYVSFNAFRISPLGGRIIATNLVLSNSDYTISILRLNITWRYWLLNMIRISDVFFTQEEEHAETSGFTHEINESLDTRVDVLMDGLEIFVYNRESAYTNIIENLEKMAKDLDTEDMVESSASEGKISSEGDENLFKLETKEHTSSNDRKITNSNRHDHSLLRILPVGVRVRRGAFVVGNHTTPYILVASFTSALGIIDLAKSPCIYDQCRLNFDIDMEKFQISMKPNITFNPDKYTQFNDVVTTKKNSRRIDSRPRKNQKNLIQKGQKFISRFLLRKQHKSELTSQDWRGLRRYVGDFKDEPIIELDDIEEYAKYSLLLVSASTKMLYYFDIAGTNPEGVSEIKTYPKFGVDLLLTTGSINYGSWAERHRGFLQALLFPQFARDGTVTDFSNGPGDQRRNEGFNLNIKTTDELVLRVPTREFSKDREDLKTQGGANSQKQTRPFGWIEVTCGSATNITLFISYMTTEKGSKNRLDVCLSEVEVRTSVTHDLLFTADTHTLGGDIVFPLKWNAECIWNFEMTSANGVVFFLGEHITLFTDLVSDFASGPPTKHELFRPFIYNLSWVIKNYRIYLNVNDGNIFDDSLDFESNSYLCFKGPAMNMDVSIPARGSFAKSSKIDFYVSTPKIDIFLEVPPYHTVGSFMKGKKYMGTTGKLQVDGYYKSYSNIEVNHNNLAYIEVSADDVSLLFYGYLVRYFFALKENYFGDFKNFQTNDEYLQTIAREDGRQSALTREKKDPDYWGHYKIENDLNVIFSFQVKKGLIVLPCQIYDYGHHIGILFNSLDVDIHLTNYYMDLQTDFSPADCHYFKPGVFQSKNIVFDRRAYADFVSNRTPEFIIDTFSVHTHRMLGLDLNTYQCKWDFYAGDFLVNGDPMSLTALLAGLLAFMLGFKDFENTHKYVVPIIYDAANFSFRCPKIEAKFTTKTEDTYFRVIATDILLSFNDVANLRYSDRITVLLPEIIAEVVNLKDASHCMYLRTSLIFNDICQKEAMLVHRSEQQSHVRRNDAPTHRAPFVLFPENRDQVYFDAYGSRYPLVSLPTASKPLDSDSPCSDDDYYDDEDISLANSDERSTSINDTVLDEFIEPTIHYVDEDFMPQTQPTTGQKNDAFILELEPLDGFINPDAIICLSDLALALQILDLDFLIDRLHCETVKSIIKLIKLASMIDNIRFVCPSVNLKIAAENTHDLLAMLSSSPPIPVITITAVNPSVVAKDSVLKVRSNSNVIKETSMSIAVHAEEIRIAQCFPHTANNAFSLLLKDLEAWVSKTEIHGQISSSTLQEIELAIQEPLLKGSLEFCLKLVEDLKPALLNFEEFSKASSSWRKQLAYLLSPAAAILELQLDSKVITKPSRLHRSVMDHVRFFDSWKVVSKFRNLLNDIRCYEEANQQFLSRNWNVPLDGFNIVFTNFKSWRAWEGNLDERRRFFESLFLKERSTDLPWIANLKIVSLAVSLLDLDDCKDFLSIRDLDFNFVEKKVAPTVRLLLDSEQVEKPNTKIVLKVLECDLSLSQRSFVLAETVIEEMNKLQSHNSESHRSNELLENRFLLTFGIESFHFHLALAHTNFNFYSQGTSCMLQLMRNCSTESEKFHLSFNSSQNDFSAGQGDVDFITLNTRGVSLVTGASLPGDAVYIVDFDIREVNVEVRDQKRRFIEFFRGLDEDVKLVKSLNLTPLKGSTKGPAKAQDTKTDSQGFNLSFPNLLLRSECHKLTLYCDIILPLKLHIVARNGKLQASSSSSFLETEAGYSSLSVELVVADTPVLRTESSRFGATCELKQMNDLWAIKSSINLGYFKASMQLFFSACEVLLEHKTTLENEFLALQDAATLFARSFDVNEEKECKHEVASKLETHQGEPSHKFAFEMHMSQEYCGFLTYKELCRYSIEVEEISLLLSNYDRSLDRSSIKVPVYGDVSCSGARITVLDPLMPVGLSTMIDLNISAKLLNDDVAAINKGIESQSIQIVSEYLRVCLSPQILFKLFDFLERLKRLIPKYEALFNNAKEDVPSASKEKKDVSKIETGSVPVSNSHSTKKRTLSSFHVLSYNFCVGWLFGGSYKDYPGFICGAERLFAVTKSDIGKLTMMGGYFSVANGSTASSFFSTSSEMHGLNRAFMPKLQINYFVNEARKSWINIKGDQLDVRFMSNLKIAIERTVKSIADVQKFIDTKTKTAEMRSKLAPKTDNCSSLSLDSVKSFKPNFSGVEITVGFAGSRIFLYRLQDDDFNDVPSSLTLHCPAVLTVLLYKLHKENERKHLIKAEMLISRSDNTVYPSCVPVIEDFASTFKSLFLSSQSQKETPVKGIKNKPEKQGSGINDIRRMLKDFDFHMGILVEPQKVSLSCEPVAKVAAVVEFDGASITVSSGLQTSDCVHAIAEIKSISASLQHIYSDERSGTIEVHSILFSNVTSLVPPVENFASVSVLGITGYVKMKQYQDVDLFSDIWFPSKDASSDNLANPKRSEKTRPDKTALAPKSGNMFRETSQAMSTILVQLDFIVSKVFIEVDFGSALGTVKLGIDSAWVISLKSSEWNYSLNLGLQTLSVDFNGRLGGYLRLNKLFLNSSIEWKIGDLPVLDVPLIHMSGGFGQISLKGIFDDHVFAFISLTSWFFDVYNRKNDMDISKDHLHVRISYEAVNVSFTSLSASDFYDIYSTINRMIEENKTSYREILKDSNEDDVVDAKMDAIISEDVRKLETRIEVSTGLTRLQVFPHSFIDTKVFVLECDLSKASFAQNEYSLGVMNQIELQLNNVIASFSTTLGASEEFIDGADVNDFVDYVGKAKGGEIISLPKFMISMRTYQKFETMQIEYVFQSSFGGTVNIRWNLGSVNCVRDMYAAHKRALLSRTEATSLRLESTRGDNFRSSNTFDVEDRESLREFTTFLDPPNPGEVHKDFDQDIQDTLEKVSTKSKFTYKALAPPIIEAPQLRELGNATPPLEWFGLHRNKFPDAVHQLAIVALQKVINEIEQQYSKTLGKA